MMIHTRYTFRIALIFCYFCYRFLGICLLVTVLISGSQKDAVWTVNMWAQDIIDNPDIHLDEMFIASLVSDLIKVGARI